MKLIFAGTPEFAREALVALHAAGHEIVLVMTQPDRPAGRVAQDTDVGSRAPPVQSSPRPQAPPCATTHP